MMSNYDVFSECAQASDGYSISNKLSKLCFVLQYALSGLSRHNMIFCHMIMFHYFILVYSSNFSGSSNVNLVGTIIVLVLYN